MILRPALHSDVLFFYHLRNDPAVIEASATQRGVGWKEHTEWFLLALEWDISEHLFVAEDGVVPVGTGRITIKPPPTERAELSLAVHEIFRNFGFGKQIIYQLKEICEEINKVPYARVRRDNHASLKCFLACDVEIELI